MMSSVNEEAPNATAGANLLSESAVSTFRKPRRVTSRINWRVPSIMGLSIVFGMLFSVGHHLFYEYWDGKSVENAALSQKWVLGAGTAFAFAVKVFCGVTTGTAYAQLLWRQLQKRSTPISDIDALFNILSGILGFFKVKMWIPRPLLLVTAAVTW